MTQRKHLTVVFAVLSTFAYAGSAGGQVRIGEGPGREMPVDKVVVALGEAAGVDLKAKDEAVAAALRKAVEEGCGVFLTSVSKTSSYQTVYDKIFASAVGYVREHSVLRVWVEAGVTKASVRARVSTRKFSQDWAAIAHTVEQENNPRVVLAIVQAVRHTAGGPVYEIAEEGSVQGKMEDFFINKGITLMDRKTGGAVSKRDLMLAVIKNDTKEAAALAAKFKADVLVVGRASAKYGRTIQVAGQTMYQFSATLTVRVIEADSAVLLASKSFGPEVTNCFQQPSGSDAALAALSKRCAPKVLAATVEAWRRRANVRRSVQLMISEMDYNLWKAFRAEVKGLRGVVGLRLREITEKVAYVDVEYKFTNEHLADTLTELKSVKLEIGEITANRIKLKVGK